MDKLNLYQKINAVMKDIEYLTKDDTVSTGKNSASYKAISEEKVTRTVRESLMKNGLVILPVEQDHMREDTVTKDQYGNEKIARLTTVNVKYKIVNIDNPTEFEFLVSSGTGVDTQDKGVGKAMTYSYKYMLLRTFAIPTGEDPDKVSSETLDQELNSGKKVPKEIETITEPQQKRLFNLGKGNTQLVKEVLMAHGFTKSSEIPKGKAYEEICKEIESKVKGV